MFKQKKIHRLDGILGNHTTKCNKPGKLIHIEDRLLLVTEDAKQLTVTDIDGQTTCRMCMRVMLELRKLTPPKKQRYVGRPLHIRRAAKHLGLLKG